MFCDLNFHKSSVPDGKYSQWNTKWGENKYILQLESGSFNDPNIYVDRGIAVMSCVGRLFGEEWDVIPTVSDYWHPYFWLLLKQPRKFCFWLKKTQNPWNICKKYQMFGHFLANLSYMFIYWAFLLFPHPGRSIYLSPITLHVMHCGPGASPGQTRITAGLLLCVIQHQCVHVYSEKQEWQSKNIIKPNKRWNMAK